MAKRLTLLRLSLRQVTLHRKVPEGATFNYLPWIADCGSPYYQCKRFKCPSLTKIEKKVQCNQSRPDPRDAVLSGTFLIFFLLVSTTGGVFPLGIPIIIPVTPSAFTLFSLKLTF